MDDIRIATSGADSYEVKITESLSGKTTIVVDTTLTGGFNYDYMVTDAAAVTLEVDSPDKKRTPTLFSSENGTADTDITLTDVTNVNKQIIVYGCCSAGI